MAFRVHVEGQEPFDIPPECTKKVKFTTDIPLPKIYKNIKICLFPSSLNPILP